MKKVLYLLLLLTNFAKCQSVMDKRMIIERNGEKEYYISTAGGIEPITRKIKEKKYILIDDNKTWNPHPVPLTDSDYLFIKQKLPEWFAKHTKILQEAIQELDTLSTVSIQERIKYIFTWFGYEEEDVYLLKMQYKNEQYRIYICKRPLYYVGYINEEVKTEKNKLMYPFEDEKWNRNFYETEKEYLIMRKQEEDGDEKYYK